MSRINCSIQPAPVIPTARYEWRVSWDCLSMATWQDQWYDTTSTGGRFVRQETSQRAGMRGSDIRSRRSRLRAGF